MDFPTLNHDFIQLLRRYKNLKFVSTKYLEYLSETNEYYQKLALYFLGLSGKSQERHRKDLVKNIRHLDSAAFRKHLSEYQVDCQLVKAHQFYLSLQQSLNEGAWWQNGGEKSEIAKIKKFWQRCHSSSHLTSAALYSVANQILPIYESYYQLAYLEIKRNRKFFSAVVLSRLKNYKESCCDFIAQEKKRVCEAMLSRLKVASENASLKYDDVSHYALKRLQNEGYLGQIIDFEPRQGLSKQLFRNFNQYIFQHGSNDQRKRLHALPWFRSNEQFSTRVVDDETLVVPNQVSGINLPVATSRYLFWLFPNQYFYADFLKEKLYDLVKIRRLYDSPIKSTFNYADLNQDSAWLELGKYDNKLEAEWSSTNQKAHYFFNKFLMPSRFIFFKHWAVFLEEVRSRILERKIKVITALNGQLQTRLQFGLDTILILSKANLDFMRKAVNEIDESLMQQSIPFATLTKWQKQREFLLSVIQGELPESRIRNFFEKSEHHYSTTSRIAHQLLMAETSSPYLSDLPDSLVENRCQAVVDELIQDGKFNLDLPDFSDRLDQLSALIREGRNVLFFDFVFWKKFFAVYLQDSLEQDSHPLLENILLFIKDHAPSFIQSRACTLTQFATQNSFIYQIKCKAVLSSLQDEGAVSCELQQPRAR